MSRQPSGCRWPHDPSTRTRTYESPQTPKNNNQHTLNLSESCPVQPDHLNDDLKQMFVYNVQFDASRSILLYPRTGTSIPVTGTYSASKRLVAWPHDCQMDYADFFDADGAVRKSSGIELLKKVM